MKRSIYVFLKIIIANVGQPAPLSEDIQSWIQNNRLFVLPDLAVEILSNDKYWEWKNNFMT